MRREVVDAVLAYKTDPERLARWKKAAQRKMTAEEWEEQLVSFIASGVSDETMSKEEIRAIVRRLRGQEAGE